MNVYFLPGIGADHRLFTHITLPSGFKIQYLDWIDFKEGETIPVYAARMADRINKQEKFILIGVSLGGMVGVEIAKITSPVCTIIIGSVPIARHLPHYYQYAKKTGLQKLLPPEFYKLATIVRHLFTIKGKVNRRLLRRMIYDGDRRFISWAIDAVLRWDNDTVPQPLIHIHGTNDPVLPVRFTSPHHLIKGGHLLVINQYQEVNTLLGALLAKMTDK